MYIYPGGADVAQTKRIMISLPNTLLQEVDGIANQENINRSQLIREAMRFYINELKKRQIRQRLQLGYVEMSKINLSLANEAVEAENEAVRTIETMVGGA
ncbi:MAG: ribbon-helix-helix protein, CopG family [Firmicutes bacterium]|jgi:CopG family transcriptional regulator/antitoxin EndoAI|nr:ribbon-helix-helix protein, CopG family [Bacillota bacterium]HOB34223.1 ribbon-helix-helix protein, CopG family [Bacillota bacterium]HPZ90217.1 ribbon-helix-helix protein, CopG family [Bacillota bacterium]HQE01607.1 ribbon-helix-helix protein, CopG family [Bacillota bacterium]